METGKILDRAASKAKEALAVTDTSVDAKLLLNGMAYEVETFNIRFQKEYDYKGESQREMKGGFSAKEIKINGIGMRTIRNVFENQLFINRK